MIFVRRKTLLRASKETTSPEQNQVYMGGSLKAIYAMVEDKKLVTHAKMWNIEEGS